MLVVIYGGSCSGKSSFAEDYVCKSDYSKRYYLATMSASDEESKKRIKRHQMLRAGKGFETIECPVDVLSLVESGQLSKDSILLLECMSNLVANEMFRDGRIVDADEVIAKVVKEVLALENGVSCLTIVTNNVFEDGVDYDDITKEYLRALGRINAILAKQADKAFEVIVGIGVEQ